MNVINFGSDLINDFIQKNDSGSYETLQTELDEISINIEAILTEISFLKKVDVDFIMSIQKRLEDLEKQLFQSKGNIVKKIRIKTKIKSLVKELSKKFNINDILQKIDSSLLPNFLLNATNALNFYYEIITSISNKETQIGSLKREIETKKQNFYIEMCKKYHETPITIDDVFKTLSIDNLSNLSIDDYAAVIGAMPGDVLTHVTRQGLRDHTGMVWHTAGNGEIHDGFKEILKKGKLLSGFEMHKEKGLDIFSILGKISPKYRCFEINENTTIQDVKTREEMLFYLHQEMEDPYNTSSDIGGHFSPIFDKTSIHFGVTSVLDDLYGGEKDNECFLIYPQAMAIVNHAYQGTLFQWEPNSYHNDIGLLPLNSDSISLDAALIFLPENTLVDRITGSKYKICDDKVMLDENGIYKLAEDTILAREYWEKFLSEKYPNKKFKIVYYNNELTPTEALQDFLQSHGIDKSKSNGFFNNKSQQKKYEMMAEVAQGLKNKVDYLSVIKKRIHDLIDFQSMEQAINAFFDDIQNNPHAAKLLKERDEYLRKEGFSPYEKIYKDNHEEINVRKVKTIDENFQERISSDPQNIQSAIQKKIINKSF